MKLRILIIAILILGVFSCDNDDNCSDNDINITSLESEYGCTNTKYQMDIGLSENENYIIISNQSDFTDLVIGSCQPTIDFSVYDLVIGKQGLGNGNSSIDYKLVKSCDTDNLKLTVTFNQNDTMIAPNLTYHALIPKINEKQELSVEIIIN